MKSIKKPIEVKKPNKVDVHYRFDWETMGVLNSATAATGLTATDFVIQAIHEFAAKKKDKSKVANPWVYELAGLIDDETAEFMMKVYRENRDPKNRRKIKGWLE